MQSTGVLHVYLKIPLFLYNKQVLLCVMWFDSSANYGSLTTFGQTLPPLGHIRWSFILVKDANPFLAGQTLLPKTAKVWF